MEAFMKRLLVLVLPTLLVACAGPGARPLTPDAGVVAAGAPAPTEQELVGSVLQPAAVPTNWKERLEQPYVFLEERGDYRVLGESMRRLFRLVEAAGVEPTGAPFALFYDDPARVPAELLRARVCVPVATAPAGAAETLRFDVLPRAMVAYTHVAGSYPDVPRVYPTLMQYMHGLGWTPGTPIREVYLVDPGSAQSLDELVAEVQIPWTREL